MPETIVPILHVPDVRATAQWYQNIGFRLCGTNEDCGVMDWAQLTLGKGEVMFSAAGSPSDAPRREVDLYIQTDDVQSVHARLKDRVEIVEDLHDTFYGMREFIFRDCNRFWITFGQCLPHAQRDGAA